MRRWRRSPAPIWSRTPARATASSASSASASVSAIGFSQKICLPAAAAAADEALEAVARAGVRLQIGFQRRFDPAYERAHAAIRAGELGRLFFLRSTTRD